MQLAELLSVLEPLEIKGSVSQAITGIAYDSRRVKPGHLFIAIPGFSRDGHDFIDEAVVQGARAVVISREVEVPAGLASILVADPRRAMALAAAKFFDYPAQKMRMIGITGTNGKTTTAFFIDKLLRAGGYRTGIMGTLGVRIGSRLQATSHTTPESLDLQGFLAQMCEADTSHAILEVSSHALALDRALGCEFNIAVFTNFTQDHLDFHGEMLAYLHKKSALFQRVMAEGAGLAIINADDAVAPFLSAESRVPILTYGMKEGADFQAVDIHSSAAGISFRVKSGSYVSEIIPIPMPGYFNIYNALAAIVVALGEGIAWEQIYQALPQADVIPGRMQAVDGGQPFAVFVDYAHTPAALASVLKTLRSQVTGRLLLVFGCGGERDKGKRARMGQVADLWADLVIITADNPRSEDPARIAKQISETVSAQKLIIDLDRASAIQRALRLAMAGDAVLIAGKGHETYQILGDKIIDFDDQRVAQQTLEAIKDGLESRKNS